jgi:hypothetical protein
MALLQDQVEEVGGFVERCCTVFAMIYDIMFPQNPIPKGFTTLMKKFCCVKAIQERVRQQMIGGSRTSLGFVQVHHPQIDLEIVGSGLPHLLLVVGNIWKSLMHLCCRRRSVMRSSAI